MRISFSPLEQNHFPILMRWLNTEQVNRWYGESKKWTLEEVSRKYESYLTGYDVENDIKKPIYPFVIEQEGHPVGYIQYYDAYDFARDGYHLKNVPKSLAALDVLVNDEFSGRGIGVEAIRRFLNEYIFLNFKHCLVDPDPKNLRAVHVYEKAGFQPYDKLIVPSAIIMLANKR